MDGTTDTRTRILHVAERLAQERGYNGFSYADIAGQVGIKTASIHYHFPGKGDLGRDLAARYRAAFAVRLAGIDRAGADARGKLERYAQVYLDVLLDGDRMCLCGMLAADIATLPAEIRDEVLRFFADQEAWLSGVLEEGRQAGILRFAGSAHAQARVIVAALEGAMLVARAHGDAARFRDAASRLIGMLEGWP
jgi:TetR/AcrR family transcriptional repressor of nem operon